MNVIIFLATYALMGFLTAFVALIYANVEDWDDMNRDMMAIMGSIFWPIGLVLLLAIIVINALNRKAVKIAASIKKNRKLY